MLKYFLLLIPIISSCNLKTKADSLQEIKVTGNWLILYPKEAPLTDVESRVFAARQDSIVSLMCLKLISIKSQGQFTQMDSLYGQKGSWILDDSGKLNIKRGGAGFDDFNAYVLKMKTDTLLMSEFISLRNQNIELIWHLKRVHPENKASALFKPETNSWRQRPSKKETDDELKQRLVSMLTYYSLYYELVSKESVYFLKSRIFLPFEYYQHSAGLKKFDPEENFAKQFFDLADARKAYDMLNKGFQKTKNKGFPSGDNFVIEYAMYFEELAKTIL